MNKNYKEQPRNKKKYNDNKNNYRKANKQNNKNQNENKNSLDENNVIFGKNTVEDSIINSDIAKIYLQKKINNTNILDKINKASIPYVYVEKEYLDKITDYAVHQGVAAVVSPVKTLETEELINKNKNKNNPLIIMLDELQDPQNLGAILRSVDAFKIDGVIFNKRRNAQITGTVAKVSTGAINHVDLARSNNLRQDIKKLKKNGYWVAYLDMDGDKEVSDFDFDLPLVVIVGGEDKGVTDNIKKECDMGINIKMNGSVNSLNVSSAVSILCYQKNISRK